MKTYIKATIAIAVVTAMCMASLFCGFYLGRRFTILTEELVSVSETEYCINHNGRIDVYDWEVEVK